LRDGQVVGSGRRADFTLDGMISLMVGRNINQLYPARSTPPSSQKALEVKGVSQDGVVENISFDLHRGEVLGIAGLMGSGRSELARILFGLDPHQRGQVLLHGTPIRRPRPRTFIRHGMAFLTENRREEGLCLEASIADNIALVALPKLTRSWFRFINPSLLARTVADISQAVRLAGSAGDEQAVKTLSGGNQQKVVVAKWLLRQPTVLIFDEPTRGIDVGAKVEIYQLIADLAGNGAGLLIISSEIEELIGLCDRILVMANGEIKDCMERNDFDRERILRAALAGARTLMPSPSFEVHDGRAD
jgi:ribose transport system ATP-binding protein